MQCTGVHLSPIVVFNFEGYYDHLLKWFNVVVDEGFATRSSAEVFSVICKLDDLEEALTGYKFRPSILHHIGDIAPIQTGKVPSMFFFGSSLQIN